MRWVAFCPALDLKTTWASFGNWCGSDLSIPGISMERHDQINMFNAQNSGYHDPVTVGLAAIGWDKYGFENSPEARVHGGRR